ncbi:MAG: glycosyltransferase family 39 protein, partial [Deltaproteobacteria bacterium]|nr:glycosyltransferase family 39 protein [Deltaproteobacteria bacterium]
MGSARRHSGLGPLALLLAAAAAQYGWNACAVTPLVGYDSGGHAGYMLSIRGTGSLPHPLSGWSTFHPPLYHLAGAGVWSALEPLGARAVVAGLRGISALAMLAAGVATFILVRRLRGSVQVAWLATALVLFVPSNQLAAAMIGNEALGAGLAALALIWIVKLQRDPYHLGAALAAGLFVGLALATKYTGFFVATASVVPFARSDLDRRMLGALGLCVLTAGIIAGPIYARNAVLNGSLVPMTRGLDQMKKIEAYCLQGERSVADYFKVSPGCLGRPSIYYSDGKPVKGKWNPALRNV